MTGMSSQRVKDGSGGTGDGFVAYPGISRNKQQKVYNTKIGGGGINYGSIIDTID